MKQLVLYEIYLNNITVFYKLNVENYFSFHNN